MSKENEFWTSRAFPVDPQGGIAVVTTFPTQRNLDNMKSRVTDPKVLSDHLAREVNARIMYDRGDGQAQMLWLNDLHTIRALRDVLDQVISEAVSIQLKAEGIVEPD